VRPSCFSTLGCAEFDWPRVAALAARHGMPQVELRALADRMDLPAYLREQYGTPERFAAVVEQAGLSVPVLDTSLNLFGADAAARAALLEFGPWADALGARWLRVFDGGRLAEDAPASAFAPMLETVAWWRAERERHGWKADLAVETHDCLFTGTAIRRFQALLPRPVGILWDAWHTWFRGGERPADTWRAIGREVVHLHIKDGVRRTGEQPAFRYVFLGKGEYPFNELAEALRSGGYSGAVSLEWERKWHPTLEPLEEVLAAAPQA
jgi:sugar phosphate isomerase/epimerase